MKTIKLLTLIIVGLMLNTNESEAANPLVNLETSFGTIQIELNKEKAPITVANFESYVKDKFYDETIFHRVISNFMIQGGGYKLDGASMTKKTTKPAIKNESNNGLSNVRGTISMARLPSPDTASSQFFINVKDNPNLDFKDGKHGYAVFGKVISGMKFVDKIKEVSTTSKQGMGDVPVEPVMIKSAKITKLKIN